MYNVLLLCPLCGKLTPDTTFLSQDFVVEDIYGVEVHGRGRGKGFRHSEKFSILEDRIDIIDVIKSRLLDLAEVLELEIMDPNAADVRDAQITDLSEMVISLTRQLIDRDSES